MKTSAGERGMTLLEILVAVALVSVMVMLACVLITSSMRFMEATGRSLQNPIEIGARSSLRRDIQGAVGLESISPDWCGEPLVLRVPGGKRVEHALDGDRLIRRSFDVDGKEEGRHVILRRVARWQWRCATGRTVDIRISVRQRGSRVPDDRLRFARSSEDRTELLRFTMRQPGAPW
jgi:prepilin-type N-terminal cleavage/methylation domain-containing protein